MKPLILVFLTLGFVSSALAQSTDNEQTTVKAAAKSESIVDAEAELTERRTRARSLLISLSSDARRFQDQILRARSLARIADALWQVDAEQARALFRKAWEAAEAADIENDKRVEEEIRQQRARTGGGFAVSSPPNIRREVLRLVARHDRDLGEELLEKLRVQKLEAANSTPTENQLPGSDALSQRLTLAAALLQAGEIERSVQFAEPALAVVSPQSVYFLSTLRAKDANLADRLYASMLASASNNPQSDANTASLLSSYIFTPHLYVTFSGTGGTSTSQMSAASPPAEVTPELMGAFFQTAASILLRPLPPPGQDRNASAQNSKYLVIKRLLPIFEQSASPAIVESLRGHLNALNAIVTEQTRRHDEEYISKGIKPEQPAVEREQALLDQIDRAKTSAERDALYLRLAFLATEKGDMRARDFVSKVEDSELRKQALAYVDPLLANRFIEKKLTDQALELTQKGELTHLQKVWALARCAKLLAKADPQKALELIDQGAAEARRIDVSDPSHPKALIAVANALKEIDSARVWDATFDAVKAANSAEGFSGEDGMIVLKFQSKVSSSVYSTTVAEFNLEGIFRDLATEDYDRAVGLARGFQSEGPRAVATIAIARAVLDPKKLATQE